MEEHVALTDFPATTKLELYARMPRLGTAPVIEGGREREREREREGETPNPTVNPKTLNRQR